jgi:peptidoglycan-associated lipoprotein
VRPKACRRRVLRLRQIELKTEALDRLAKNADFMLRNRPVHGDHRRPLRFIGTNEYNLASPITAPPRRHMVQLGVAANRLRTVPYGERPFCTAENDSCWAQNRRGHFVITGRN